MPSFSLGFTCHMFTFPASSFWPSPFDIVASTWTLLHISCFLRWIEHKLKMKKEPIYKNHLLLTTGLILKLQCITNKKNFHILLDNTISYVSELLLSIVMQWCLLPLNDIRSWNKYMRFSISFTFFFLAGSVSTFGSVLDMVTDRWSFKFSLSLSLVRYTIMCQFGFFFRSYPSFNTLFCHIYPLGSWITWLCPSCCN